MSPLPVQPQTHVYKQVDGCTLRADVFTTEPRTRRPVLLWIHGGALIFGSRRQLPDYQLQHYLDAGFTVVSVDYRLAPETKLDQIVADLKDAYTWILTDGSEACLLDGDRVAVVGHSAGGYLTLMAGFCVDPRPQAVVAFYGYGDIIDPWYSEPDPFYRTQPLVSEAEARRAVGQAPLAEGAAETRVPFYLYCRQTGRWPREVSGHDPHEEPDWFNPFCPAQNVSPAYAPTLLIHGDHDTDVPYAQSVLMAEQLARHGVDHEFISLAGFGHAFDSDAGAPKSEAVQAVFARVTAFLKARV